GTFHGDTGQGRGPVRRGADRQARRRPRRSGRLRRRHLPARGQAGRLGAAAGGEVPDPHRRGRSRYGDRGVAAVGVRRSRSRVRDQRYADRGRRHRPGDPGAGAALRLQPRRLSAHRVRSGAPEPARIRRPDRRDISDGAADRGRPHRALAVAVLNRTPLPSPGSGFFRWSGDDSDMTQLHVAHTADLDAAARAAARDLLFEVFDDMTDEDWEHCLGGLHTLAYDGGDLIGHASVIQRRLVHGGRALRTGYVEGVAVRAGHRRRGVGAAMMAELERVIRGAYDIGALGTTDDGEPFYLARGWQLWRGASWAMTPDGVRRTADDDGAIYVFPNGADLDLDGDIMCAYRPGDVW